MTGRAGNLVRYRMRAAARRAANADLRFATPELAARHATLQRINAIRAIDPDAQAEPNLIRRAHLAPNDPLLVTQWHYDSIRLPLAWDVTTGSSDVIVAVVDTGVLTGHPDFAGQLVPGFDFVSDPSGSLDGDGIDADPNDPGDGALFGSSSFHGTHVAGTVAARTDNGVGVAGSGWNTRIMPLRALAGSTGSNFDILQAIRFAAGLSNDSGTVPAEPADVINLSLGSEFSSPAEAAVLAEVRALGIIVVASAGNESTSQPSFPAAYDGVVSVSATTIDNNLATYSNFGNTIDIAAPGGDNGTDLNGDGNGDGVLSAIGDDSSGSVSFGYGLLNGTSMAAPHVAGVVALMKAVHPALTPDEFDTALIAGDLTEDLGVPGRDDQFGFGLLSAQRAVFTASELASGNPSNPGPFLTGSASRLNFGSFQEELALTVENAGGGSVSVTAVTPSEPWLAAIADSVDGDGLGAYRLTVDRMGLADGTYTGSIRFDSTANAYTVNALMQVSSIDLSANAGTHFVILVSEAGDTVAQTFVNTPVDGFYDFTLTGIDAGNYRLFAGTDLDNDDFLCDAGEACGAFRTIDAPEEFSVSDNRSDLDFTGGFRQTIGAQSRAAADGSAAIPAAGFAIDKLRAKAVESQAGAESRP
ncbi:MAG: S8 family peptidase [Pseudomonadota bacterium]